MKYYFLCFTFFISFGFLYSYLIYLKNYAKIEIIMCDVGQGDSVLIQQAFRQIVIDGGADNRVLECLGNFLPFWDKKIDVILLTHPQADHMNGFIELLNRYQVEAFISQGFAPLESDKFKDLIKSLSRERNIQLIQPVSGNIINIGEVKLKFLWPRDNYGNLLEWDNNSFTSKNLHLDESFDPNTISLVFRLDYKNFSALFTGDIGFPEEKALLTQGVLDNIDLLKVAHHGSRFSTSLDFLKTTSPDIAIIGVGENNRFGHPHKDTLERLRQHNVQMFRTDIDGNIKITSNGYNFQVKNYN